MTALLKSPLETRREPGDDNGQKIVLYDINWQTYQKIGYALLDRNIYLTYDRGVLEIMVVSLEHERFKALFGILLLTLARYFQRKIGSFGSFTHQRKDLLRGLEPDQCFYLANLKAVQGKKRINLRRDPPPDLAIEVEITRSSLDRMGIYAALGITELWRFDGTTLQAYALQNGQYEAVACGLNFPEVPVRELGAFLHLGQREDDLTVVEALETWLKKVAGKKKSGRKERKKS